MAIPANVKGVFVGMPLATITSLISQFETALAAIAARGQSYSIAGRSLTSADLPEIRETLAELYYAKNIVSGVAPVKTVYTDFRKY